MIITISGDAGSGKSTISELISKELGLKKYSTGSIQRKIANERGVSIAELGELEKDDKSIDNEIDQKTKELGEKEKDFIMDSWLAAKFIPHAIKIFLTADIDERVKRRLKQKREEESFTEKTQAKENMLQRENTNRQRWIKFYGFDYKNEKNYDIIVDTTNLTIEQVKNKILEKINL